MPGERVLRPFVVVNPLARRASSALAELVRQCRELGIESPRSVATTPDDPGTGQARRAIADGADLIVVIGGDGTVREVAREVAGTSTRLAIVALGSGNVLAHNLGLARLDLAEQVRVALTGRSALLDLGLARLTTADGHELEEPFLTMAGIGRDAETVANTELGSKLRWGWGAYALAGLRQALRPALAMQVSYDDEPPRSVLSWTILAGITPAAPGGVLIHRGAVADDGLFDVLEVPIRHPGQWLPVALKGLTHHGRRVAALRSRRAAKVVVRPVEPLPVQVDGDVVERVVRFETNLQPRTVRVQIPTPQLETQ